MGGLGSKAKDRIEFIAPTNGKIAIAKKEGKLITILLQGSGESGKSTVLKQFQLIHGDGFKDDYKELNRDLILNSILIYTNNALVAMQRKGEKLEDEAAGAIIREAGPAKSTLGGTGKPKKVHISADLARALVAIANDPKFQHCVLTYGNSVVQDGLVKLLQKFKNYPTFGGDNWKPSDDDLLNARVKTAGANTDNYFTYNKKVIFNVIDVGGQRAERRRYAPLFKQANQILYVTSLSEYDQFLYEAPTVRRIDDSLQLFKTVTTNNDLKEAHILVFLNKKDLFVSKYRDMKIPLPRVPGFRDPPKVEDDNEDCDLAIEWFKDLYIHQAPGRVEKRNFQVTVATSQPIMQDVISVVSTEFIRDNLTEFGFPVHDRH